MKTAIVILNWNGQKLLSEFLPVVLSHSISFAEVYVADNASTDGSLDYVKNHFPQVKWVAMDANRGYAGGYNTALKQIEADVYVLMNSDIATTPQWLVSLLQHFDKHPQTAIIQPKILDYRKKTYFEYAGAGGGFIDRLGYPFCRGRVFNALEEDLGQYNDVVPIFWASGACLCIRAKVFWELGGLDEDFFAHQEEIDLCWRAHKAGYRVHYVGTSTVYHVGGATLNSMNPAKTFFNFRNTLLALLKNAPRRYFPFLVISRLILDGVAGLKFILEGKWIHSWAIMRAHFSFYRLAPKILKKRKNDQKFTRYYQTTSIVWKHFVMGVRKFEDL